MKLKKIDLSKLSKRKQRLLLVGGLLILLFVVFLTASYFMNKSNESKNALKADPKVAEKYRTDFVNLGNELTDASYKYLVAVLDDSNSEQANSELTQKGNELAKSFGKVYGKNAESEMKKYLDVYYKGLSDYSIAVKKKDPTSKNEALSNLKNNFAEPTATLIYDNAKINIYTAKSGMKEYVDSLSRSLDFNSNNKKNEAKQELNNTKVFIAGVFEYIADTNTKQFPNKFQN